VMSKGAEAASQGLELGARGRQKWHDRLGWCEQEEDGLTSGARMPTSGKRQGDTVKDTNPKGKHICENTPMAHRPSGPAEEVMANGMGGTVRGRLGRSGYIQGEDSVRN
jgi:hypothetical protein